MRKSLYKQFYIILKVFFLLFIFCFSSCIIAFLTHSGSGSVNKFSVYPQFLPLCHTRLEWQTESSGATTSSCPQVPRPHTHTHKMRFLICDYDNWQLFSSTLATKQGIRLSRCKVNVNKSAKIRTKNQAGGSSPGYRSESLCSCCCLALNML